MKSLIRVLMAAIMGAVTIMSLGGCCEDEPVIIVPEPVPAAPVVKGTITTNGGEPLAGALVTLTGNKTYTAYTDGNGNYSIQVDEGSYDVTVSKDGYTPGEGVVIAVKDVVTLWNAILPVPIVTVGDIKASEDTYIEVPVPPLVEETTTGAEVMTATIPAESTDEDDVLIMEFSYDASFVDDTKVSRLMRLVNVNYYLLSGGQLKKPIHITVPVPAKAESVKLNDKPVDCAFDPVAREIRITTRTLGRLTMDYYVDITEGPYGSRAVSFQQNMYDNFYGSAPMRVQNPKYSYFTGGYLSGNHVLLNSLAAVYTGAPARTTVTAEYPMDLTLPVGGKLVLRGSQALYATEFDVADGLMHSTVVEYLGPVIEAESYNRQHTGGSN